VSEPETTSSDPEQVDALLEEMKGWDRVSSLPKEDPDEIIAYEGETDDELRDLYGFKPPD